MEGLLVVSDRAGSVREKVRGTVAAWGAGGGYAIKPSTKPTAKWRSRKYILLLKVTKSVLEYLQIQSDDVSQIIRGIKNGAYSFPMTPVL